MKNAKHILILISLTLLILTSCTEYVPLTTGESPYKTVVIIGMDGAGGSYVKNADTPSIQALIDGGNCAYSFEAHCELPSSSAQNWGALLHGVTPEKLEVDNGVICAQRFRNINYPSLFTLFRLAFPDCYTASVVDWNPINYGLIESYAFADKYPDLIFHSGLYNDEQVKDLVIECLKKDPKLVFVQFDETDSAGHSKGYGSTKHKEVIERLDSYIGEIYDECDKDSTLFIITADHGGKGTGHGGDSSEETEITFIIKGKTIKTGADVSGFKPRDLAPIVLTAMNMRIPAAMEGTVPENLFITE